MEILTASTPSNRFKRFTSSSKSCPPVVFFLSVPDNQDYWGQCIYLNHVCIIYIMAFGFKESPQINIAHVNDKTQNHVYKKQLNPKP